ncbi:hypothetical protein C5167_041391 [Papaver somniferum]|nr:hypothetical protein C5167_041391 [Papaver somniferum]
MMNMTEEIVVRCALAVQGKLTVDYTLLRLNFPFLLLFYAGNIKLDQKLKRIKLQMSGTNLLLVGFGNKSRKALEEVKHAQSRETSN